MNKNMIFKISKILSDANVYHKVIDNTIFTRKSITSVPTLNKDIAYLMGVITGDGHVGIYRRKRGGFHYSIQIYSGSKTFLVNINRLIQNLFNYSGTIPNKRKGRCYELSIQNATIFWYFVNLGLHIGKKIELSIPKLFRCSKLFFIHYLAGLIDTDGSISYKKIHLKQKSKNLLEELRTYLIQLKMNPSLVKVNYTDSKPFYYIRFDNKLPLRFRV